MSAPFSSAGVEHEPCTRPRTMRRAHHRIEALPSWACALGLTLWVVGCGVSRPGTPPTETTVDGGTDMDQEEMDPFEHPAMVGRPVVAADIASRTFEFPDAFVFGVTSPMLLTGGQFSGTPSVGPFRLKSLANSDEASGALSLVPCVFTVAKSSFPTNALIVSGARLSLECNYDPTTATLRIDDPKTKAKMSSIGCTLVSGDEDVGPCLPTGGS